MKIDIKPVQPERDAESIAELINLCIKHKWTTLDPYTAEEEKKYIENMGDRECIYVAYVDGVFAGFAGCAPKIPWSSKLSHCAEGGTWVHPEYWGSGVSKMLWTRGVLPFGEKAGFLHYSHPVPVHNSRAIRHYEKLGFSVCGYHRGYIIWPDGEREDAVIMERWTK